MPVRLLREGILTSERVNSLSIGAEVFYRRLMSVVDDYGRYYAKSVLLRTACFPLRVDTVKDKDIAAWLSECTEAGLILLYAEDGKHYLQLLDFRQQIRTNKSKFPAPDEQMLSNSKADAKQLLATAHLDVDVDVDVCGDESDGVAVEFARFWESYPKKVGKPAALRAFKAAKINGDLERVLDALRQHRESVQWTGDNGRYIPNPATWLNQRRWEDEPPRRRVESYA